MLYLLSTQAVIRARRHLRHLCLARLALRIEPVGLKYRLTVLIEQVQYLRPFLLRIILQRGDRGTALPLTAIPIQMGRVVAIAALARFQTQRCFAKSLGFVPLPRPSPGKILYPLAESTPPLVHCLVQPKAKAPDFSFHSIGVALFP